MYIIYGDRCSGKTYTAKRMLKFECPICVTWQYDNVIDEDLVLGKLSLRCDAHPHKYIILDDIIENPKTFMFISHIMSKYPKHSIIITTAHETVIPQVIVQECEVIRIPVDIVRQYVTAHSLLNCEFNEHIITNCATLGIAINTLQMITKYNIDFAGYLRLLNAPTRGELFECLTHPTRETVSKFIAKRFDVLETLYTCHGILHDPRFDSVDILVPFADLTTQILGYNNPIWLYKMFSLLR